MDQPIPLVRHLDHVLVEAEDPTALFRLFSEGFGLPVAFEFGDYGEVLSGSVWAGNMLLQFARFKELRFGHVAAWDEADAGRARLGGLGSEDGRGAHLRRAHPVDLRRRPRGAARQRRVQRRPQRARRPPPRAPGRLRLAA